MGKTARNVAIGLALLLQALCPLGAQRYTAMLERGSEHYIIDDKVNVREKPSLSGGKIDQLNAGKKVTVLKMADEWLNPEQDLYAPWYKIAYDGKEGYVCGLYLTHKEVLADFDDDGKEELLGCVTVSEYQFCLASGAMESFRNWDVGHVIIKDGAIERIVLSREPKKALSKGSSYAAGVLDLYSGRIPFIVVKQGFGDGGGSWTTEDYYYRVGHGWEKAFTLNNMDYECDFTKREELSSSDKIYVRSVTRKWDSASEEYVVEKTETRVYVWDGKTIRKWK